MAKSTVTTTTLKGFLENQAYKERIEEILGREIRTGNLKVFQEDLISISKKISDSVHKDSVDKYVKKIQEDISILAGAEDAKLKPKVTGVFKAYYENVISRDVFLKRLFESKDLENDNFEYELLKAITERLIETANVQGLVKQQAALDGLEEKEVLKRIEDKIFEELKTGKKLSKSIIEENTMAIIEEEKEKGNEEMNNEEIENSEVINNDNQENIPPVEENENIDIEENETNSTPETQENDSQEIIPPIDDEPVQEENDTNSAPENTESEQEEKDTNYFYTGEYVETEIPADSGTEYTVEVKVDPETAEAEIITNTEKEENEPIETKELDENQIEKNAQIETEINKDENESFFSGNYASLKDKFETVKTNVNSTLEKYMADYNILITNPMSTNERVNYVKSLLKYKLEKGEMDAEAYNSFIDEINGHYAEIDQLKVEVANDFIRITKETAEQIKQTEKDIQEVEKQKQEIESQVNDLREELAILEDPSNFEGRTPEELDELEATIKEKKANLNDLESKLEKINKDLDELVKDLEKAKEDYMINAEKGKEILANMGINIGVKDRELDEQEMEENEQEQIITDVDMGTETPNPAQEENKEGQTQEQVQPQGKGQTQAQQPSAQTMGAVSQPTQQAPVEQATKQEATPVAPQDSNLPTTQLSEERQLYNAVKLVLANGKMDDAYIANIIDTAKYEELVNALDKIENGKLPILPWSQRAKDLRKIGKIFGKQGRAAILNKMQDVDSEKMLDLVDELYDDPKEAEEAKNVLKCSLFNSGKMDKDNDRLLVDSEHSIGKGLDDHFNPEQLNSLYTTLGKLNEAMANGKFEGREDELQEITSGIILPLRYTCLERRAADARKFFGPRGKVLPKETRKLDKLLTKFGSLQKEILGKFSREQVVESEEPVQEIEEVVVEQTKEKEVSTPKTKRQPMTFKDVLKEGLNDPSVIDSLYVEDSKEEKKIEKDGEVR